MSTPGKALHRPPLMFLSCLLLGWGLGFVHPLGTGLPTAVRIGGGALLWLAAAGLGAWALLTFRRQGTTPDPNGVATALLTSGPFHYSRNPLYVALCTLLAGFGLLLDSAWVLALMAALVLLLDRLVIAREEVSLHALFGEAYVAYTHRVRRWL